MELKTQGSFGLLGVVHGHWQIKKTDLNLVLPEIAERDGVNIGIAIVTPASKILDLLYCKNLREARAMAEEREYMQRGRSVTMDAAITMDPEDAMQCFGDLGRRLFQAPKGEADTEDISEEEPEANE